jgi:hypothetical protein
MPETLAGPEPFGANCNVNSQLVRAGMLVPQVVPVRVKGPSGRERERADETEVPKLLTVIAPAALFAPTMTGPKATELEDNAS